MHDAEKLPVVHRLFGPREFGIAMISLGVGALILATIQHRAEMKVLADEYKQYGPMPRFDRDDCRHGRLLFWFCRPDSGHPPHVAAPALGPVVFLIYGLLAMVAF